MTRIALTRTCDAYKYTCIDAAIVQNLHIHDAMVVSGWNTSPLQMVTHNVLSYSFQTANGNSTAMATSSVFFFFFFFVWLLLPRTTTQKWGRWCVAWCADWYIHGEGKGMITSSYFWRQKKRRQFMSRNPGWELDERCVTVSLCHVMLS